MGHFQSSESRIFLQGFISLSLVSLLTWLFPSSGSETSGHVTRYERQKATSVAILSHGGGGPEMAHLPHVLHMKTNVHSRFPRSFHGSVCAGSMCVPL